MKKQDKIGIRHTDRKKTIKINKLEGEKIGTTQIDSTENLKTKKRCVGVRISATVWNFLIRAFS